jgi:hypothetical protein
LRLLDLFCGLKGWSDTFKERGHEVVTVDVDPSFNPDICIDVRELSGERLGAFDVVLASPPCECFSVASIGKHWNPDKSPKTTQAIAALQLVSHTLNLIQAINPKYWLIENPRGMMRNVEILKAFPRHTVTYCQYGENRMKPTDLWGVMPNEFSFKPPCQKRSPCHVAAPRGSKTGTQGMGTYAIKSLIPKALALEVCLTLEMEIK